MSCDFQQAKGSSARVLICLEADGCYNEVPDAVDRRPMRLFYNSEQITLQRNLNESQTIDGSGMSTEPFQGNTDVAGPMVVPVEDRYFGLWLLLAIGLPTTYERPYNTAVVTNNDVGAGGTVTIDASGGAEFSVNQPDAAVNDRVILRLASGVEMFGFITTKTDNNTMVIKANRAAGSNIANLPITAATVVAICKNRGTFASTFAVDNATGIGTFSVAQANLAVGKQIIYDDNQFAYITEVISTTSVRVVTPLGLTAPADFAAGAYEALENRPRWLHLYKVARPRKLRSAILEVSFEDMDPKVYHRYQGVKVDTMEIEIGGDGELLATMNLVGADRKTPIEAGDDSDADHISVLDSAVAALEASSTRFHNFQATATEGGSTVNLLTTLKITHNNQLDRTSLVIGGGGVKIALPEGIAKTEGSINALFADAAILNKAKNNTESSIGVGFENAVGHQLSFAMEELKYAQKDPGVTGPAGVRLETDWKAYYNDGDLGSIFVATLLNDQPAYYEVAP